MENILSRKIKCRNYMNMITAQQRIFYRKDFVMLPTAKTKWMKSKWVVFQAHTITLSNGNILLPESHFLTDAIKFAKFKEKHGIYLLFQTSIFKMHFMVSDAIKKGFEMLLHSIIAQRKPHTQCNQGRNRAFLTVVRLLDNTSTLCVCVCRNCILRYFHIFK